MLVRVGLFLKWFFLTSMMHLERKTWTHHRDLGVPRPTAFLRFHGDSPLAVEVSDDATCFSASLRPPLCPPSGGDLISTTTSSCHHDSCVTAGIHPENPTAWVIRNTKAMTETCNAHKNDPALYSVPHPPEQTSFDLFLKTGCRWTLTYLLNDPGNQNQALDLRSAVKNLIPPGQDQTHASRLWAAGP